jgi:hypothetical protein
MSMLFKRDLIHTYMAHSNNADLLSFSILRQMSRAAVYEAMSGTNTSPKGQPIFELAYLISV